MAQVKRKRKPPKDKDLPSEIAFDYIKSNFFRVTYADGVFGGPTPRGHNLQMVFWSQRKPIPKTVKHRIEDDGSLGPELERESRVGLVREAEVAVIMDTDVATALRDWLNEHLEKLDELLKEEAK